MGKNLVNWGIAAIALAMIVTGCLMLEAARHGVEIRHDRVGQTPVTITQRPGATGPVVVVVHGFAGSRQLMQAWSLSAAQSGYIAVSLDLQGHGRNPIPMSGDLAAISGTTQLLVDEIAVVVDWARNLPGATGEVALIGHSMASDLVIRHGLRDPAVGPIVAISSFSAAITPNEPQTLLILNGAWEGRLRAEAQRIMAEIGSVEGQTVGQPGDGFARRAVSIPRAEHVGILFSRPAVAEARDWIAGGFGDAAPQDARSIVATGPGIVLLMMGIVALAFPLTRAVPQSPPPPQIPAARALILAVSAAVLTPVLSVLVPDFGLPVLVADYLAVHLTVFGALILLGAWLGGWRVKVQGWGWAIALTVYGLGIFGLALDRYVASFLPHLDRLLIIAALFPGAVLAMMADAVLGRAGSGRMWQRVAVRSAFLLSLGIAVALDFERLFFLVLILPVIVLFYASFGLMGGWLGRRTGSVAAMGLGLGILLAWALGVSFPLYSEV